MTKQELAQLLLDALVRSDPECFNQDDLTDLSSALLDGRFNLIQVAEVILQRVASSPVEPPASTPGE